MPKLAQDTQRTSLHIELGERSYDILIGTDLIDDAGALIAPHLKRRRVAIITDQTVAKLHLERLRAALDAADITITQIIVPPGEATKSLSQVGAVIDQLLDADFERGDLIVALGGGVVGDLAGFVSAVIHRGTRFVQIPTTLLAQVDSSVGGKTGVNAPHGKNLIGAFHQPALVLSDTAALTTLPPRELRAGYAELVKHGLLGDRDLFDWLDANHKEVFSGGATLATAIRNSCAIKARIVEQDEREGGVRALLNLGHTFGHALEAALGYTGELLHGEAVAIGIAMAFELSERLGHCRAGDVATMKKHFAATGLETSLVRLSNRLPPTEDLVTLMGRDKKVVSGRKTLVLVRGIGEAFLSSDVDDRDIHQVIDDARTS